MMNAVLSSFSEGVTFLLQSFRLAFVLPSFLFLGANTLFITPALPSIELGRRFLSLEPGSQLTIVVALSFLLGYFLAIINVWLIRLFEGYHWRDTGIGKSLIARKQLEQHWWKETLRNQIAEALAMQKAPLKDPKRRQGAQKLQELVEISEPLVNQILQDRFPVTQPPFLPTSLGNAVAAFEDYPRARYGIDAVLLWPRLLPTLTKRNFAPYIERNKAQFDFLINLCFLLLVLAVEVLCVGLVFADDWSLWMITAGLALLSAAAVYKLSLLGAQGWGMSVRVAFDLYRYDLLAALCGRLPKNYAEEKALWLTISRFLKKGHQSEIVDEPGRTQINEPFDYEHLETYVRQEELPAKEKRG